MDDQHTPDAADDHKKGFLKNSMRPLSLLVVAFSMLGSLFLVERTDTPATATDPGASAAPQSLGDSLAISHRNRPHRPSGPNDVDAAIRAARFTARQALEVVERIERHMELRDLTPEQEERAAARLLQARARFLSHIDILIDMVPAAEDELLEIQAEVLARIDALLEEIGAPISG